MNLFELIAVIVVGYLLGAIPFAHLITKKQGIDIFSVGSGNCGATNVTRALGKPEGLQLWERRSEAEMAEQMPSRCLVCPGQAQLAYRSWIICFTELAAVGVSLSRYFINRALSMVLIWSTTTSHGLLLQVMLMRVRHFL